MRSSRNDINRTSLTDATEKAPIAYSAHQYTSIKYIFKRRILRNWRLYILILPAVVYYILFKYKPIYGIILAFKDYKISLGIWGSEW